MGDREFEDLMAIESANRQLGAVDERAACAELVRAAGCICFKLVVFVESGEDFDGEIDYEGPEERPTVTKHDSRCPQALAARRFRSERSPMPEPREQHYGYGIVDRFGLPWWNEACVCEDRGPMEDAVVNLNDPVYGDDPRRPYRVVELVSREGST